MASLVFSGTFSSKTTKQLSKLFMQVHPPIRFRYLEWLKVKGIRQTNTSVNHASAVMDCCHERRSWSCGSTSRSCGDCADSKFVPSKRFGTERVLPPSR